MKPFIPFFLLSSCLSLGGRGKGDDGGGAGAVRAVARNGGGRRHHVGRRISASSGSDAHGSC
jgi:hypothetical protein